MSTSSRSSSSNNSSNVTVENPTLALSVSSYSADGNGNGNTDGSGGSLRMVTLCLRSRRTCATVRVAVDLLRLKSQFFDHLIAVKEEEGQSTAAKQSHTYTSCTPTNSCRIKDNDG